MTRLETLLHRLKTFYGPLPSPPSDPFTLFVWEVLSVHSIPRKRDASLAALRKVRALTPDAMWKAPQKKLEESVALAGPYLENRLRALRTGVDLFRRTPALAAVIKGPMPAARRALKPFPILGEGGAHRMLVFAAGHAVLPVDSRVSRVGRRLGYGESHADFTRAARSVQAALEPELPTSAAEYGRAYVYLSHHGAATCTETDPHCGVCPLLADCPEGRKRIHRDRIEDRLDPPMKMPAATKSASESIDERIKELGDWRGRTLAKVRDIIHQSDPEIVEEWKWAKATNPGTPVWSHGGIVCTGEAYKNVVKMTFARGAALKDPLGLFNSSLEGNVRRAIDIREGDTIDEPALKNLIRAAVALNVQSNSKTKKREPRSSRRPRRLRRLRRK